MGEPKKTREDWLIDLLHYAIQFHVCAEAKRDDVAAIADMLSDSDEYDDNVAALVQMPKWISQSEVQDVVDRHFRPAALASGASSNG